MPCVAIVGLSALLNLALQIAFNPMQRLEPPTPRRLLALNIVELAALLYLHRRAAEPVLVPVPGAGPDLGDRAAGAADDRARPARGRLRLRCWSSIHLPLPWDADEPLILPPIYLIGVWLSIVLAIGVTSLYAFQVTEEARKLSDALAATELVLAREQHLTQLDGLAAAAAHELGTPLSTIVLISRELEHDRVQDESARRRHQDCCANRRSAAATSWPRSPSCRRPARRSTA